MWPIMASLSIGAFHADAVFASGLQRSDAPSAVQVRQAITAVIQEFGSSGCAARVAQEFGDHPETAVIRMRWARAIARDAFTEPAPGAAPRADAGDGEGAALEMEQHLRSLLHMGLLALPGSKATASEAAT